MTINNPDDVVAALHEAAKKSNADQRAVAGLEPMSMDELIQQGIFDYNINTTAAGMTEEKGMEEAVRYFKALFSHHLEQATLKARIEALTNVDTDDDGYTWYVDGSIEHRLDEYLLALKAQLTTNKSKE